MWEGSGEGVRVGIVTQRLERLRQVVGIAARQRTDDEQAA
jgi:hypothetical protein